MTETNKASYDYKWYVMAAVAMSSILAGIDGSIVNVALPTLVRDLQTNFSTVQWVVLAYLLTIATLILGIGRLADIRGKKRLFNAGFVIFTIGSMLCGLAPSIAWLIGFRVLQGIGAALTMALAMAIITEAFPPDERGKAIGITGAVVSFGYIAGPTLGGFLIGLFSWRWIFFVNLPVGLIGIWLSVRYVPETPLIAGQKFDYWGGLTLFVSLFSLLLALTLGQERGFGDTLILLMFGTSFLFIIIFIAIELNVEQPMIYLGLFYNQLLTANLLTAFVSFISLAGSVILLPFYLENIMGYEVAQVGILLIIVPVALGITSPIAGTLSDRFGVRSIIITGLILQLIGYYAISTLDTQTNTLGYVIRLLPVGLGMGIFVSPNNSAIMGSASPQQLGIVSGLVSVSRTLGQSIGVAVIGAIWAGRVFFYEGGTLSGGVTAASIDAQMAALQETFLGLVFVIAVALTLSVWSLIQERRLYRFSTVLEKRPLSKTTD